MLFQTAGTARAQQDKPASKAATPASTDSSSAGKSNQTSKEEILTFTKRVNLVVVPVVVRDKQGKAVGSLRREDFQIFDNGKPQTITTFNLEANGAASERAHRESVLANVPIDKALGTHPSHFFAYLFDDVHLLAGDLMQVRAAAKKHLESGIGPDDRAAVFTTSGDVTQGFTTDRSELTHAMDQIKPGFTTGGAQCPYMNAYLGQKIVEESEGSSITPTWDGATDDTWECMFNKAQYLQPKAREVALDAARRQVLDTHANTQRAMLMVEGVVRRLAAMPGARTLILVSPGFLTTDDHIEQSTTITLATERNIVINALDARGLYTGIAGADTGTGPSTMLAVQLEEPINRQGLFMQTNVLAELAEGTGGKFFRDNNDLLGGFNQLATPPEYVYVLAFRPEVLKQGGHYHQLKVTLGKNRAFTVQARHGYYEPAGAGDPQKLLSEELEKALFSRDEMRTMPITLKSEYAKKEGLNRELSVTTHVDVSGIHFQKADDRNVDNLTLVCGLFDINGNYLQGKKQEISLRLEDDVLKKLTDGMNIKTTFNVEPGAYLIRVLLRDSRDELLSAVNGSGIIQ